MPRAHWIDRERRDEVRHSVRFGARLRTWSVLGAACLLVGASTMAGRGQETANTPSHPKTELLIPEANKLPDVNDQLLMNEKNARKQNFNALNALRIKQIDDDATKLLILTRDLNDKMSKLGKGPIPPNLVREAEVIELLAHDVQTKMTLTVGGS